MKLDPPANSSYAAQIIRVPVLVDLPGLDNLVGVPVLGHQALTQKDVAVGDLRIVFTAETQLSEEYACQNDLHRDPELNKTDESGYLERNRRIRALKLRGNTSNALLMPLSSLAYTGINPDDLREGDCFDVLNGHPICRKYEIPVKASSRGKTKIEKAFRRVDTKLFPEHIDTDQFWRNKHLLRESREVIVTQKLHGTSIRVGRVPCLRQKSLLERLVNRFLRIATPDYEYDFIAGSRKVIKDPKSATQQHYYSTDIWTEYGKKIADLIPEGYLVFGELVGWTPDGAPLQKNYTYEEPSGSASLYVYRVATINAQGVLSDLPWDGVKEFCTARGLSYVPELHRIGAGINIVERVEQFVDSIMDKRIWDEAEYPGWIPGPLPLRLSNPKTVDEGVCIRQEGLVPLLLKAKSPIFLEHETKLLDKGEADIESMESVAA